jgi:hypothetical protein
VTLCTVPALCEGYQGDFDLKKAARAIFLTLNKTARKVSESRNRLLDDNDMIAVFMRRSLSTIKNRDDRSQFSLRMWNVELDQSGDKLKILSPIAITGVNHIYYMVEHMLLDSGDICGVAPRSGKFYKRTNLDDCLDRLNGKSLLGDDLAGSLRRDSFSSEAAEKLGAIFDQQFGYYLIRAFEAFAPSEVHNRAVLQLEARIQRYQDRQLRPIILEGQGLSRVFESHRSNLRQKLKEGYFSTDVPTIEEALARLNATGERIEDAFKELVDNRAEQYLSQIPDKKSIRREGESVNP